MKLDLEEAFEGLDSAGASNRTFLSSIMAVTTASISGGDFFFKGESGRNTRGLLRLLILCTIAAAAIAARLFSVIRFESIIHECEFCPREWLGS